MQASRDKERLIGGIGGNRRSTARFPLREELRYRILQRTSNVSGSGRALNMGSGGLLFTTEELLPIGRTVEVSMNWPAMLGGTCPLKFVAVGRVVRSKPDTAAVRIEKYEFRTRASGEKSLEASSVA